jgi:hypothetical protein
MRRRFNAIATDYGQTRYKSRLEARFAEHLTRRGEPFEYEPVIRAGGGHLHQRFLPSASAPVHRSQAQRMPRGTGTARPNDPGLARPRAGGRFPAPRGICRLREFQRGQTGPPLDATPSRRPAKGAHALARPVGLLGRGGLVFLAVPTDRTDPDAFSGGSTRRPAKRKPPPPTGGGAKTTPNA